MPRRKPDAEFTKSQDNNTQFKSKMRHQKTRKKENLVTYFVTGSLFLKAEIKVPSSSCSISPPTGNPWANLVILILSFLIVSSI